MTDLSDVSIAAAVRDAVRQIASSVVQQEAPKPQFGRVISVNFVAMTATVWFPGDPNPVSVKLFSGALPGLWQEKYGTGGTGQPNTSTVGFGSRVAVETLNGTPYVTQILNGGQFSVDFVTAGNQYAQYGVTGDPGDAISGDYTLSPMWDTNGSPPAIPALPNNGGPYAINIGPFITPTKPYNSPGNSNYEIDVISLGSSMSQKYEFNLNPYFTISENTATAYYDKWFRVIPKLVEEMNSGSNTGQTINGTTYFDSPHGLGLWQQDNAQSTVTLSQDFAINAGGYSMKIISNTASTAAIGAREGTNTSWAVLGGSSYSITMSVYSPTTWADIRPAIDWYDISGTLISSFLPTASSIAASTWTTLSATAVSPATAAYAVPRCRVGGTPPTTQAFYVQSPSLQTNDSSTRTDFNLDVSIRKTIHASTNDDPANSAGEIWFRIYIHWLDAVQNPYWAVRVKSTNGYASPKSNKTGKPVYEYIINPADAVGYLGYHDSNGGYTSNATQYARTRNAPWSSGPWRNPDLTLAYRAQEVLTGGGIVTWNGTNLKWTLPFEVGGVGRSRSGLMVSTAQISMPTTGQIPIFPDGLQTAVLTGAGIPLQPGQSLWFGIPPGLASATIPNATYFNGGLHGAGGLFIVDNSSKKFWSPPEWAVFLAYRGTDANQPEIKLGTGNKIDKIRPATLLNGWGNWGGGFASTSYTMINGLVVLHGVPSGGSKTANIIFTLPVGWRPAQGMLFMTAMSDSTGIVQVAADGSVSWYNGTATWVALDNIRFIPEQ